MMITCIYISGNACRSRVIKLKTQYKSPNEAYSQSKSTPADTVVTNDFPEESGSHNSASSSASQMQISPSESDPISLTQRTTLTSSKSLEACSKSLAALQPAEKLAVLTQLFRKVCEYPVETDFLQLAFSAMQHLKKNGRSNLVYQLCKCVGTMRSDGSDSLLPVKRMPTGLIEYVLNFYSAQTVTKVSVCMYR